ncbi:MAG: type I restriction-modification system subunit M [Ardenticatenaceae bacterium]|nr:type I restriction-modification system subunit M [Ardenticatenaceae bacterium]
MPTFKKINLTSESPPAASPAQPLLPLGPSENGPASTAAEPDINFEGELWDAAVRLRGTVAPADYRHYVLPLLFLRYLSLRYEQRHEQLRLALQESASDYYTGDPEIDAEILADPIEYQKENIFVVPEEASWAYLRRHARAGDIKLKLDNAMRLLEERHPKLAGVLPRIYAASNLEPDQVAGLISLFSKDVFARKNGADLLGRTYEYFISNFASTEGNRGGEFFTPSSIVRLLVEMLQPTEGKVFDPAAGSGGMFVQSARFTYGSHSLSFYGQERIETTLRLCRMNLILHGVDGDIRLGNSLLNDAHPDLRADYVITNPPFNMRGWDAGKLDPQDARLQIGYRRGQVTDSNANYMWMMHFLYHLADGGTAGYVMANGAMTSNVSEERRTREVLVEEGFVDCIVQLPDKLFFGTGIPCTLWFLSKNRGGTHGYRRRLDEILFIDARQMGEMVSRRQRALTDDEIHRIASVYHHYRTEGDTPEEESRNERKDVPGFCKIATLEQVRAHDYKLTPGIYVGTQVEDDDGEPFEEKMPRLIEELRGLFAESDRLRARILEDLEHLNYGG